MMSAWRVSTTLILFAVGACVPLAPLEGMPCPCPSGFTCCELTRVCMEQAAACPRHYPASSQRQCSRDNDCGPDEICPTWTHPSAAGVLGPGRCQHLCQEQDACAPGEVCAPTPHDAAPLDQLNFVSACQPEARAQVCQALSCLPCPTDKIGTSFCGEQGVHSCFFTLDPECGLACREVILDACDPTSCVVSEFGPSCLGSATQDPCIDYPCAPCPGVWNSSFCHDSAVTACMRLPFASANCSDLCVLEELQACTGACIGEDRASCAD